MSKSETMSPLQRLNATLAGRNNQPDEKLPATVTGPIGTVPGAGIDTTRSVPEPRQLSAHQAEMLMQAELLSAVRSLVESSTEIVARLGRRGASNGVIESWAGVFPASGVITRTYEVAIGCVSVENLSAAAKVIVTSGVAAGDTGANSAGVGVSYVRANSRGLCPLADHSVTFTGTAGDFISFEAFTGLQPYGVSSL